MKAYTYIIGATEWTPAFREAFGPKNYTAVRELTGDEVVELIRKFGRATIEPCTEKEVSGGAKSSLYFENDSDS